jgi:hypothetical protein
MFDVWVLDDNAPDPACTKESHDRNVRVAGALIQGETIPIQERAHEESSGGLSKSWDEGTESVGADSEVEVYVGAHVRLVPAYVNEKGSSLIS